MHLAEVHLEVVAQANLVVLLGLVVVVLGYLVQLGLVELAALVHWVVAGQVVVVVFVVVAELAGLVALTNPEGEPESVGPVLELVVVDAMIAAMKAVELVEAEGLVVSMLAFAK